MKRVVFVTPPDARYGFSLCGSVQMVAMPGEAEALVRSSLADPESGVVVVDERLLPEIGDERFRELERRWFGILVVLPAPESGGETADYALRLIRRAIGYQVRLQR